MYNKLPSIQEALDYLKIKNIEPSPAIIVSLRELLQSYRDNKTYLDNSSITRTTILEQLVIHFTTQENNLQQLINATGTILHTNLGRAPLSSHSLQNIADKLTNYINLEFSLTSGERSSRAESVIKALRFFSEAEDVLIVNNNAAAIFLCFSTLAQKKEVLLSRGEIVEIGDSFRISTILSTTNILLKEVGTTNCTYIRDYEEAITEETIAILRVNPSNYTIRGFTKQPNMSSLHKLAKEKNLLLIEDLGSGIFTKPLHNKIEPSLLSLLPNITEQVKKADLVTTSADKLLGSVQAGIIFGKKDLIQKIRRNPLYRALRVSKITLAWLEESLLALYQGKLEQIPILAMLAYSQEELRTRAKNITALLPNWEIEACESVIGGGCSPNVTIPSWGIVWNSKLSINKQLQTLRQLDIPIIARCSKKSERVLLDLRTTLTVDDQVIYKQLSQLNL